MAVISNPAPCSLDPNYPSAVGISLSTFNIFHFSECHWRLSCQGTESTRKVTVRQAMAVEGAEGSLMHGLDTTMLSGQSFHLDNVPLEGWRVFWWKVNVIPWVLLPKAQSSMRYHGTYQSFQSKNGNLNGPKKYHDNRGVVCSIFQAFDLQRLEIPDWTCQLQPECTLKGTTSSRIIETWKQHKSRECWRQKWQDVTGTHCCTCCAH